MKLLPNLVTFLRLILIFPILFLLISPGAGRIISMFLFIICAVSDWLDGYLARKLDAHSAFGQFLDPLIDKFLMVGTFVIFIYADPSVFPFWLVWLVGVREFVVTMIRIDGVYEHKDVPTLMSGKVKTVTQFVAVFLIYALLIIKDQVALNIDNFTQYINSPIDGSVPLWKHIFGIYGTKIVLALPTMAFSIVTFFTLYSGIVYIKKNKNFFS